MAQYDNKNDKIYFQYYNDVPIGFILNDVQYFYVTNLNGDIVAITDVNGNLIAKYSYDEWGKLLNIETADDFNCLDTSNKLNANAYIYCCNCPVAFHDVQGTTPKLSINLTDIISFIQNINNRIKDGITTGVNKLRERKNLI